MILHRWEELIFEGTQRKTNITLRTKCLFLDTMAISLTYNFQIFFIMRAKYIVWHFNNHFDLEILAVCPKRSGHETNIVYVYLKSRSPLSKILFLPQGFLPHGRLVSFLNDDPDVITISLFFKITF